jgi:hypothetical protein
MKGIRSFFPVGGIPGILVIMLMNIHRASSFYLQPIDLGVMGHGKDELVANTIYAYCTANNFHSCVLGVIEDEMVPVEVRQQVASDTTSNLRWFSQ